uniref:hypothetical protein n=1 Tax=Aliarcobacter sp. TaxID=2321116 RepID=UPI0040487D25
MKNNKLEAVVISTDEYERLKEIENIMDMLEHKEIYQTIQNRKEISKSEFLSLDEMSKKFNIDVDSL